MKRYGMVIKLVPGKYEEYKKLHAAVWPEILALLHECNMRNYSIYHRDGYLFSYFEYVGEDLKTDWDKMLAADINKKWWEVCQPCQQPVETAKEGEWWAEMEELFHME